MILGDFWAVVCWYQEGQEFMYWGNSGGPRMYSSKKAAIQHTRKAFKNDPKIQWKFVKYTATEEE